MTTQTKTYRKRRRRTPDDLPEQTRYVDDGCEESGSCLTCPLPQCRYDDPAWYRAYRQLGRDLTLMDAYVSEGTVRRVAHRFEISPRTVHRALHRLREPMALAS